MIMKIGGFVLIVVVLYFGYKKFLQPDYNILSEPVNSAKLLQTIPPEEMTLSQSQKGLSFTTSFWIFLKDWNYKYLNEKIIMDKGGFKLGLGEKLNDLYLEMPIYNSLVPEKITYDDLPLQKWIHICIVLDNRNLDLWLNGKLYGSKYLPNLPKIFEKKDTLFCPDGGFSGFISRIYHYEFPLPKNRVIKNFHSGPINTSYLGQIKNYFMKTLGFDKYANIKFSVSVDVDTSTDDDE